MLISLEIHYNDVQAKNECICKIADESESVTIKQLINVGKIKD